MKTISFLHIILCCISILFATTSCKDRDEPPGSIYGTVTDKATGEPISVAGVELSPNGIKTVTGSEGQFEFTELESGEYTLTVTKAGYVELGNIKVTVNPAQKAKSDIQIEKLPPALRVVDGEGNDISELDFGIAESDVTRSFNIFNDGNSSLQWEITLTAEWIKSVSKQSGTLNAGATQALILTIDRKQLKGGVNTTTMHITSNDGSKQITVKAESPEKALPEMNTLEVTDITMSTAIFHGEITSTGSPSYIERGFVASTSSMPTLETSLIRLTAPVNETAAYQATATNLQLDKTYYVRAYARNDLGVNYSTNEVSFKTEMVSPVFSSISITDVSIANGRATVNATILNAGEPTYTEKGFVYGLSHNPTLEDDTKKQVPGSGTGPFSANLTELKEGNTYYIRAYATNAKGTAYSQEASLEFRTILPEVRTDEVIVQSETSATLNGTILSAGEPAYSERGFIYGTMPIPTMDEPEIIKEFVSGSSTGSFTKNINGLTEGAQYYVRAYAKCGEQIALGKTVSFRAEKPQYIIIPGTNLMVQREDLGQVDWTSAFVMCTNSSVGGYSDWRLPTIGEAMLIYNNKHILNNLLNSEYWTIENRNGYGGYYSTVNMEYGNINDDYGEKEHYVRAVRTITTQN